jgi:dipeptidyl aminopeptidase/acylaminoacyl peptidase
MLVFRWRRSALVFAAVVAVVLPEATLLAQEKPSENLLTVNHYLDYETVAEPRISPDAARIIFTRRWVNKIEDRFDNALWLMNADGSQSHFLVKGSSAVWSPDGTRIAYLAEGEPKGTQIFVRWMNAEGAVSQITQVMENPGDIKWSPDGKWIGFSMFVPKSTPWNIDLPAAPEGAKWTPAPRHVDRLHYRGRVRAPVRGTCGGWHRTRAHLG